MHRKDILKNLSSYRKFADLHLAQISPDYNTPLWKAGTKHYKVQEWRYFLLFNKINQLFPDEIGTVLDMGCYPGDIGILLRKLYGDDQKIFGSGLHFTEEFQKNALQFYNQLFYIEHDPENPLANKENKTTVDLPDASIDLIIACEIFEHLYNPLHFIKESARLLSESGKMIITTDNLKYIGNILGLFRNKTVFSELENSHIFMKSEWRPHERLYFKHEIAELFQMHGLTVREHLFFDNHYEHYERLPLKSKINQAICKMFYIIPSFRPRHLFVFQKG